MKREGCDGQRTDVTLKVPETMNVSPIDFANKPKVFPWTIAMTRSETVFGFWKCGLIKSARGDPVCPIVAPL